MILHVLPGDAYIDAFRGTRLEGDIAIFREALIEGDLRGPSLSEFWKTRENYHSQNDSEGPSSYQEYIVDEIEKLLQVGAGDEVDLWFEYELFCSVNYWFCLYLLRDSFATIYRISPTVRSKGTRWLGFGNLDSDELLKCWNDRTVLSTKDVELGSDLWQAYKNGSDSRLSELGEERSAAFPYLKEVWEAAAAVGSKPKEILNDITANGASDFQKIFAEFSKRAGVFGLGDAQVKRILEEAS